MYKLKLRTLAVLLGRKQSSRDLHMLSYLIRLDGQSVDHVTYYGKG